MDLNYFAFLTSVMFSIIPIISFFKSPGNSPRQWGWLAKGLIFLPLILVADLYAPDLSGAVGLLLVIPFIVLPLFSLQYMQRLFYKGQYHKAYQISRCIRFLHPFDGWYQQAEVLKTVVLIDAGKIEEAAEIVERHKNFHSPLDRWAYSGYLIATERYEELIEWFRHTLDLDKLANYPESLINYFVALGETGQSETLVQEFARVKPALDNIAFKPHLNISRLYLFAYTGNRPALEREFKGTLKLMLQESKNYWLATADMTAGRTDSSREVFEKLKDSPKYMTRLGCRRRLSFPLSKPELTPRAEEVVDLEIQTITNEHTFDEPISFTRHKKKAYGTYALLGAIVAGFIMEILYGGSENLETLFRLGAQVSQGIPGQWWRAFTSLFLHFGPMHFGLNLLGLYLLGPYLENLIGTLRFLLIYFISGFGAMILASLIMDQTMVLMVGASGSLMGILGASSVILAVSARDGKLKSARRALRDIFFIFFLQFIYDSVTPEISQTAHLLGTVFGAAACLLIWFPFRERLARDVSRQHQQ